MSFVTIFKGARFALREFAAAARSMVSRENRSRLGGPPGPWAVKARLLRKFHCSEPSSWI
jgi:hypothetical protein